MREQDIQISICEYLTLKGHTFWRQNVTPIYDGKKEAYRAMPPYSMTGVSDIILLRAGETFFLEVKSEKGRQIQSQINFQELVEKEGFIYHIVRSIEDVQELGL